jgi:hypothetical protein
MPGDGGHLEAMRLLPFAAAAGQVSRFGRPLGGTRFVLGRAGLGDVI